MVPGPPMIADVDDADMLPNWIEEEDEIHPAKLYPAEGMAPILILVPL